MTLFRRSLPRPPERRWRRPGAGMLFVGAAALLLMALQGLVFERVFAARLAEANEQLLARLTAARVPMPPSPADPYQALLAEMEEPPWYLRPTATWAGARSGLVGAARFNAAIHLASSGEGGTARVLLSALQDMDAHGTELGGLVRYGLARLRFELFRGRPTYDDYLRTLEHLRQSLRISPEGLLPRALLEYLLALEFAQQASAQGQGSSDGPAEGERPSETQEVLKF